MDEIDDDLAWDCFRKTVGILNPQLVNFSIPVCMQHLRNLTLPAYSVKFGKDALKGSDGIPILFCAMKNIFLYKFSLIIYFQNLRNHWFKVYYIIHDL